MKMNKKREKCMKIGVFDSGVGGLTVLKEIKRLVPQVDTIYVGDNANVPYGTKTKEVLSEFVHRIIAFLEEQQVDLIVIACNTATALLLNEMKQLFTTPIIGVIEAGTTMALATAKKGIGIIATANTIQSKGYEKAIEIRNQSIQTYGVACYHLVDVIESGIAKGQFHVERIEKELKQVPLEKIDSLILGCTHYPLIADEIQTIVGKQITLINPALQVAKEVLFQSGSYGQGTGQNTYYTSGNLDEFQKKVKMILGVDAEINAFLHKTKASN